MSDQPSEPTSWIRLEMLTPRAETDAVTLAHLGALGVETQDHSTFMEGADIAPIPEGMGRLIAFFDATQGATSIRYSVESATRDDIEIVSVADYDDRSWETAWMDYFQATRCSDRIAVGPPWDEPQTPPDGVALVIEPGMAFGTGTHETTQLCATLLDEAIGDDPPPSMLDVGCGSAVLSMAALGIGVPRVVGIDIETRAIEAARTNRDKNGFTDHQLQLSTTPIAELSTPHPLVVANILAPILLDLRDHLRRLTAPGGRLILSGIPTDQSPSLIDAFATDPFMLRHERADGQWSALVLERLDD